MRRATARPGLLIAAGVMLLIVGGWTVFGVLCAGGMMVFANALNQQIGGGDELVLGVDPDVAKEVPSAPYVEAGVLVISLLLGVGMLFAGAGVLQVKPMARVLGVVVGAGDLVLTLLHSLYNAVLVFPVQDRLLGEEAQNFGGGPFNIFEAIKTGMWGSLLLQVVFNALWWAVVLFFLMHPSVSAAFDTADEPDEPRRRERSYPRREDFDDDDHGIPPPPDTGITDSPR